MRSIPDLIETTVKIVQSLTDDKINPMHVGEVMSCWTYLAFVEEIIAIEQIGLNTSTDSEVIEVLEEALAVAESHQKQMMQFLQKQGVPLPDRPEPKPKSDPNAVPLGAKLADNEMLNTLAINFVIAMNMCAASASQSLRTDVAMMFLQFQMDKFTLGVKAKTLMTKRGWLKIPPFYYSPGLPQQ